MNHMNSKTVMGLGVAAALAILVAVAIMAARKPVVETSESAVYALPELREHINDVKAIALTGAANKLLVTVEKNSQGWTLKEKFGYPANVGKVRELLLKLAEATLLEKKTANEQYYAELGVGDVTDPNAKGMLLALDGLANPVQLIIGNSRADGTFIRHPGDKQSWLAKGSLTVDKDPTSWLDKALMDIAAARIKEVTLRRPDGKTLRAFKQSGETNFKVADLPKGRELSSDFAANSQGSVLAGLQIEDVYPAKQAEPPADGKLYRARYVTFDGLVVDITAWKERERNQARLDASLDSALAESFIESEQSRAKSEFEAKQQSAAGKDAPKQPDPPPPSVSDPVRDRQQRLDALNAELAKMKQRFAGWTFALPAHTFGSLDQSMEGLLKPIERAKSGSKNPAPRK